MGVWYARRPEEILVDLDRATPKRIAVSCARLQGALAETLDVRRWLFLPSHSRDHVHLVIELKEGVWITDAEAIAWELYLLSDRYRSAMNLFRAAYGLPWPCVLIEPYPVPAWREPDAVCECRGKHGPEEMTTCPVGRRLGRLPASWFVGDPDHKRWREALREGVVSLSDRRSSGSR